MLGNVCHDVHSCLFHAGAFLLPYIVMLIIEGIPLLYLELSVGQRLKKGSLVAWSMISPYMGGIGLASVIICIFTGSYYSVVISWCLYYLFSSFKTTLPWSKCPTKWAFNFTSNQSYEVPVPECDGSSSISYFFFRETLNVSESIDETTTWNWKITLCYITAWIVIYVCIIRGIRSSGKVGSAKNRGISLKRFQKDNLQTFVKDDSHIMPFFVYILFCFVKKMKIMSKISYPNFARDCFVIRRIMKNILS